MSESQLSQDDVSALVEQMQAGADALATDAQTLQQAATTAQEIADDAGSAAPADAKPVAAFSPEVQRLLAIEVPIIVNPRNTRTLVRGPNRRTGRRARGWVAVARVWLTGAPVLLASRRACRVSLIH